MSEKTSSIRLDNLSHLTTSQLQPCFLLPLKQLFLFLVRSFSLATSTSMLIHLVIPGDCDAVNLLKLTKHAGSMQHITAATYYSGHTLDLILSHNQSTVVSGVNVIYGLPSDHLALMSP